MQKRKQAKSLKSMMNLRHPEEPFGNRRRNGQG